MSIVSTFTNITPTETWLTNNKSDSWATVEADGGSITRTLGDVETQTQNTVTYTSDGTVQTIHMGTWVTPSCPEVITLPLGCSFGFNHACAWESAGQLNANLYFKLSVVTQTGSTISFDRELTPWKAMQQASAIVELGIVQGSASPMGGAISNQGINTHNYTTALHTLQIGERIAVEVGISTAGRNTETVNFEFGSHSNLEEDADLVIGSVGTGPYGSEIVMPVTFSTANQGIWAQHSEMLIPWYSGGTDTISWADIGTDWSVAKWVTTGAKRYVNRLGGEVISQIWIFQDDEYLYIAGNNIIDGCIQGSDHMSIFLSPTDDWKGKLSANPLQWVFVRDITAGSSASRAPTLPVIAGDGDNQGEYVLQGLSGATYPLELEVPTYTASPNTCTFANAKAWVDGVDWRYGGPGATATAPNPNGASSGAYSEIKIKKSTLNNWNGRTDLGFMVVQQCDVQAKGSSMFPTMLGTRVDSADWPWPCGNYSPDVLVTASSKFSKDEMDLRVLMATHAHAPEIVQLDDGSFVLRYGMVF